MIRFTCLVFLLFSFLIANAQSTTFDQIAHRYAQASFPAFAEMLGLPNDAHFPNDIEKNVQWSEENFQLRGFKTTRLNTSTVPLLLAEKRSDNENAKTVLIYLQMDGQPTDSSFWYQKTPYTATLKEQREGEGWVAIPYEKLRGEINPDWRIFARSTSDAKGPVMMFLTAMDALEELKESPNFNIKIILDFEEELGSPHLPQAVTKFKAALSADMLVIFDGPRHLSNEPTLTFGARGIAKATLVTHGPRFPQHSGHYGNYIPNPALQLAQLLASMKDEDGRVLIDGYYDGIELDEDTKKILSAVPDDGKLIRSKIGVAGADKVAPTYQESMQYPSLNIRGLRSAWVGSEVRTIIPASATAEIDVRLVLESNPERLLKLIYQHIENQGFKILDHAPDSRERLQYKKIVQWDSKVSYQAFRTDFNSEVGLWLDRAMRRAHGKAPVKVRTFGGSIPISPFVTTLGIDAVIVPTVNPDNNQHSPNENIRVGNYIDGIKSMMAILSEDL
ncbi:MAG: M20/M25/M40 family metallo-hydrolase [Saprospiraceae bacterium]